MDNPSVNNHPQKEPRKMPGTAENRFRDEGVEQPATDNSPEFKRGREQLEKLDQYPDNPIEGSPIDDSLEEHH